MARLSLVCLGVNSNMEISTDQGSPGGGSSAYSQHDDADNEYDSMHEVANDFVANDSAADDSSGNHANYINYNYNIWKS